MKTIISTLIILYSTICYGGSTEQCLNDLPIQGNKSIEEVTIIMTECNNMYLKGQFKFINKPGVGSNQSLLDYSSCEEMSRIFKLYMQKCTNKKVW